MTNINKFKNEHKALIFKHAHTVDEALKIMSQCVRYILSFLAGVLYTEKVERFDNQLEEYFGELKDSMVMVSAPNICPQCGLISDWELMPRQTIIDATWMMVITNTAINHDPCGYTLPPVEVIEAAMAAGCPIYIEFFCTDCCLKEYGYIRNGRIEKIPVGSTDRPP